MIDRSKIWILSETTLSVMMIKHVQIVLPAVRRPLQLLNKLTMIARLPCIVRGKISLQTKVNIQKFEGQLNRQFIQRPRQKIN